MGRLDGDMDNGVEIVDPRGRIAQLELEIQRLIRANEQLQVARDRLERINADAVRSNRELMEKVVKLEDVSAHQTPIDSRGYRSVTIYADGTVEVDRGRDDDERPTPRRTL